MYESSYVFCGVINVRGENGETVVAVASYSLRIVLLYSTETQSFISVCHSTHKRCFQINALNQSKFYGILLNMNVLLLKLLPFYWLSWLWTAFKFKNKIVSEYLHNIIICIFKLELFEEGDSFSSSIDCGRQ